MQARQNHRSGRIALMEGFIVNGAPVSYCGIYVAASLD